MEYNKWIDNIATISLFSSISTEIIKVLRSSERYMSPYKTGSEKRSKNTGNLTYIFIEN